MPNVFIIIGDSNVRKSSTIRALTGAARRRLYDVETVSGGIIKIFVQISALQESKYSVQNFISEVNQANYPNVLVSLRVSPSRGFPGGHTYIREFINAGWTIKGIVALGTTNLPNLPPNCPTPNFIPNSPSLPANSIAAKTRTWWQWL